MSAITCPHCHAQEGFFLKEQVYGTSEPHFTKEGHYAIENGHIYDSLTHKGGKLAYCRNCQKSIGKSKDLISGLAELDIHD